MLLDNIYSLSRYYYGKTNTIIPLLNGDWHTLFLKKSMKEPNPIIITKSLTNQFSVSRRRNFYPPILLCFSKWKPKVTPIRGNEATESASKISRDDVTCQLLSPDLSSRTKGPKRRLKLESRTQLPRPAWSGSGESAFVFSRVIIIKVDSSGVLQTAVNCGGSLLSRMWGDDGMGHLCELFMGSWVENWASEKRGRLFLILNGRRIIHIEEEGNLWRFLLRQKRTSTIKQHEKSFNSTLYINCRSEFNQIWRNGRLR